MAESDNTVYCFLADLGLRAMTTRDFLERQRNSRWLSLSGHSAPSRSIFTLSSHFPCLLSRSTLPETRSKLIGTRSLSGFQIFRLFRTAYRPPIGSFGEDISFDGGETSVCRIPRGMGGEEEGETGDREREVPKVRAWNNHRT